MFRPTRQSLKALIAWVAEAPWLNRERLRIYPKIFLVAYALTFAGLVIGSRGIVSSEGKPIGVDFQVNWAASEMALSGQSSAVYDMKHFHAVEEEGVGHRTFVAPMIYPPTFLVIALPTALLPYLWALLVWMTLTFAGYSLVLRKIIPRTETFWLQRWLSCWRAFFNLMNGQNGLLAFSLLGGALLTLESCPILGGVLFGLLSYKPPMGVLVPIVLAASGKWRAFFAAALTAIALAGISLMMFGAETLAGGLISARLDLLDTSFLNAARCNFIRLKLYFCRGCACWEEGFRSRTLLPSNRGCRSSCRARGVDLATKDSVRTQGRSTAAGCRWYQHVLSITTSWCSLYPATPALPLRVVVQGFFRLKNRFWLSRGYFRSYANLSHDPRPSMANSIGMRPVALVHRAPREEGSVGAGS